jgi:hypothetical protein
MTTNGQSKTLRTLITMGGLMGSLLLAPAEGQFTVDPVRTELQGSPGDVIHGQLSLKRDQETSIKVEVSFEDHSLNIPSNTSWMTFPEGIFAISAKKPEVFKYAISIPTNAIGELYGRVNFSEIPEKQEGMVTIRTRISVPIYVLVSGTDRYQGYITNTSVLSTHPFKVKCHVLNEGNVHVRSYGFIEVNEKETGTNLISDMLSKDPIVYYPNELKEVIFKSKETLPPGDYSAKISIPFPDSGRMLSHALDIHVPDPEEKTPVPPTGPET